MLNLALALVASLAAQSPPDSAAPTARAEDVVDYETLLAVLGSGKDLDYQQDVVARFARQPDAPGAIPRLLEEMRRRAPQLDNDVGLALERILHSHPSAACPLEPLLEALRRRAWTSRQKCGQALLPLLARGDGRGREREREIAAALIPLLASQRPRVFEAGRRALEALTGEALGDAPDPWLAWYGRRFGEQPDMSAAVLEDLVVVRPLAGEGAARFDVDGERVESLDELRELAGTRAELARERGLAIGVVVHLANERFEGAGAAERLLDSEDVAPLVRMLLEDLGLVDLTLSPLSDGFRAPWRPAR